MAWEFDNKTPIFKQIIDIISSKIIKGDYKPGDKLDSVRDLALDAGVNPNTMQRALVEIEALGLVETKRGDGRYITENAEAISNLKAEYIEKNTNEFLQKMNDLGIEKNEISEFIKKIN